MQSCVSAGMLREAWQHCRQWSTARSELSKHLKCALLVVQCLLRMRQWASHTIAQSKLHLACTSKLEEYPLLWLAELNRCSGHVPCAVSAARLIDGGVVDLQPVAGLRLTRSLHAQAAASRTTAPECGCWTLHCTQRQCASAPRLSVMKINVQSRSGRSLIDGGLTLSDQASMCKRLH